MAELSTVARPYADAAFLRATETNSIDAWTNGLGFLANIIGDAQMSATLDNPNLNKAGKSALLVEIVHGQVEPELENFVHILVLNDRLDLVPEIYKAFYALKVAHEGRVDVEITSAYAVTEDQLVILADSLKKRLGKEVNISTAQDSSLIGGLVIRAGDLVIDGSIKAKLSQMATDLGI